MSTRPKAVAYNEGGFKVICYEQDGFQVVEICQPNGVLVGQRIRGSTMYGAKGNWEWVYGQPEPAKGTPETIALSEKNPIFFRQDMENCWGWRVRNIPYPAQFYDISVDTAKNQIVIRTTNKKYFKRIDAPNKEIFDPKKLEWTWAYNTLVIKHQKPPRVISQDKQDQEWRASLKVQDQSQEPDCKPQ